MKYYIIRLALIAVCKIFLYIFDNFMCFFTYNAKKTDISRPTLDRILNGENDSKSTFDKHMKKILEVLEMTPSELLSFDSTSNTRTVDAVYSQNAPADYSMDKNAKHQYDLLLDVVELCKIYY